MGASWRFVFGAQLRKEMLHHFALDRVEGLVAVHNCQGMQSLQLLEIRRFCSAHLSATQHLLCLSGLQQLAPQVGSMHSLVGEDAKILRRNGVRVGARTGPLTFCTIYLQSLLLGIDELQALLGQVGGYLIGHRLAIVDYMFQRPGKSCTF